MPDPVPRPIPTTTGPAGAAPPLAIAGPPPLVELRAGRDDDGPSSVAADEPPDAAAPDPARRRARRVRCADCGYDLAGIRAAGRDRCPECGHTLDDTDSRRTREHAFFRRFGIWIALGAVVVLGAIAAMIALMGDRAVLFGVPLILLLFGWLPFVLVARLTRDIE